MRLAKCPGQCKRRESGLGDLSRPKAQFKVYYNNVMTLTLVGHLKLVILKVILNRSYDIASIFSTRNEEIPNFISSINLDCNEVGINKGG